MPQELPSRGDTLLLILVRSVSPLDDLGIRRPLLLAQSHTNPLTTEQELSTTYSAQVCLS